MVGFAEPKAWNTFKIAKNAKKQAVLSDFEPKMNEILRKIAKECRIGSIQRENASFHSATGSRSIYVQSFFGEFMRQLNALGGPIVR